MTFVSLCGSVKKKQEFAEEINNHFARKNQMTIRGVSERSCGLIRKMKFTKRKKPPVGSF